MRVRQRLWLGVGLAAIAAVTAVAAAATGGSGVSGDNTITRFAGVPKKAFGGFSGDGGPALRAELNLPDGVAADRQGNIYIADRRNNRVRKVSTRGIITTFAGGGSAYGDGGPATSASLREPWGVAVDGQGNVYFSERDRVRKVSTNGIITTLAGTGTPGFSGDGGPATAAQVSAPLGVVVDGHGNVYIADTNNNRVRKVNPGGTITTIAGTGRAGFSGDRGPATSAQLYGPAGLALDRQGNLYIADQLNSRIRKVSPGGMITTFAGGGKTYPWGPKGLPARSALVANPFAVAVDARGSVYTGDGRLIYKVSGGRIALLAGNPNAGPPYSGDNGPARKARLTVTFGMAIDTHGNLYFSDSWTQTVRKIWATRTAQTAPAKKKAPRTKTRKKSPQAGSTQAVKAAASGLEVDLTQLASGRAKLKNTLSGVLGCSLSPRVATVRLTAVIANRQRILTQLHALGSPTAQVARLRSLLGIALMHSIAADRHYRDWLGYLQGQPRCSTARNGDYGAAQREDRLASAAKQRFVAAFNPLARQLHLRTWSAAEF